MNGVELGFLTAIRIVACGAFILSKRQVFDGKHFVSKPVMQAGRETRDFG